MKYLYNVPLIIAALFMFCSACSDSNQPSSIESQAKTPQQSTDSIIVTQNSSKKYNVFVIVADTLRYDVLGCYGGEATTPNLDLLAKGGVLFENAYSTSPWTVPSAVSMFTGNYPTTYEFVPYGKSIRMLVPDKELLFSESLKQLNYVNKMIIENPHAGLHNNFQGVINLATELKKQASPDVLQKRRDVYRQVLGNDFLDWAQYNSVYSWLDHVTSLKSDDNFFFVQWFLDPHAPYDPVPPFLDAVKVDTSKLSYDKKFYQKVLPFYRETFNEEERAYNKALYLAEVESIDERVGILLNTLRGTNKLNNTIIVFTADHGEQFGERGQFGHGGFGDGVNYYEPLVHIPLIISGPLISKNHKVKEPVSLIDLMPTLKELLGVDYGANMMGSSFATLLNSGKYRKKTIYFSNITQNTQRDALLDGNYKLITTGGNSHELYDLSSDPSELQDIAGQLPEIEKSMLGKLQIMGNKNNSRLARNSLVPEKELQQSLEEKNKAIQQLKELGYMK